MNILLKFAQALGLMAMLLLPSRLQANQLPDSLNMEIRQSTDSSLVYAYLKASAHFRYRDVDKAMTYLDSAQGLVPQSEGSWLKEVVLAEKGLLLCLYGELDQSKAVYRQALKGFDEKKLLDEAAYCIANLANIYRLEGKLDSAYVYFLESKSVSLERADSTSLTTDYLNIAGLFLDIEDYSRARKYLNRFFEFDRHIKNNRERAIGMMDMAYLERAEGDSVKALNLFEQALPKAEQFGDIGLQGFILANIMEMQASELSLAKMRTQMNQAIAYSIQSGVEFEKSQILEIYGSLESQKGQYNRADSLLNLARQTAEESEGNQYLIHILLGLSANEELRGNLEMALQYANEAFDKAAEVSMMHSELEALKKRSHLEELLGNKKAKEITERLLSEKSALADTNREELMYSLDLIEAERKLKLEELKIEAELEKEASPGMNYLNIALALLILLILFLLLRKARSAKESQ